MNTLKSVFNKNKFTPCYVNILIVMFSFLLYSNLSIFNREINMKPNIQNEACSKDAMLHSSTRNTDTLYFQPSIIYLEQFENFHTILENWKVCKI